MKQRIDLKMLAIKKLYFKHKLIVNNQTLQSKNQLIVSNFYFQLNYIFLLLESMQNKQNQSNINDQQAAVNQLNQLYTALFQKRFHLLDHKQEKFLFIWLYVNDKPAQIISHLVRVRQALKLESAQTQYSESLLADLHFCLALASESINHTEAEQDYESALVYNQNNKVINLAFSIFLYSKSKFKEGLKYLSKLKVSTAFEQQKNIQDISTIMFKKVDRDIYLQLLKPRSSKVEQVNKAQFANKILHFKECFLYRCTQIKQLSQDSYSQLAEMLFYSNRFEDSLTLIYKLRNINQPTTQNIQVNLAILFIRFSKFEEGIECAEQVLRINPRNQTIYRYLMMAMIQLKKWSQTKAFALRLMDINKYNHQVYQYLGAVLQAYGYQQLGIQFYRLGVAIQPTEQTYERLAVALFDSGKLKQAEICCFKSIRIKPMDWNYSYLGQMYLSAGAQLNTISCFIQAIKQNYTEVASFYYLGLCAKKNSASRLIINRYLNQINEENKQNITLQTNLAVFYFISKQSQSQFFDFVSKFVQQRKKGEQTVYTDIVYKLIKGYYLVYQKDRYLDIIFAAVMGYLGRMKEHYFLTHLIYVGLMKRCKVNENVSVCDTFTLIYQTQISKTPKELQAIVLQFIIAEMVQETTEQAIKCYFKSLSYAEGDYEQFHLQLYKEVSKNIDQLEPIDYIANSVSGKQNLSIEDKQTIKETLRRNMFKDLLYYVHSLELFAQIIKRLRQAQDQGYPLNDAIKMINYLKNNIQNFGLSWITKETKQDYTRIHTQIQAEQQSIKTKLDHLVKIYNKKNEYKHLLRAFTPIFQAYFDEFAINQKVKLVFNHFYPFVLSQRCHKQFAYALTKLKNIPEYSSWDLKEDLQNIFKEANKDQKKEWEPQRVGDDSSAASSVSAIQSVINYPLIDVNSQTRSQMDQREQRDEQFQSFIPDQVRSKVGRKKSESDISSLDGEDQRQFMKNNYRQESVIKKARVNTKKSQLSSSKSSEQQLQDNLSQSEIDKSNESDAESDQSGEGKWFQLQYFPSNIQFQKKNLYQRFNGFLHQNTFFLIKYLSKQKVRHIAKHKCNETKIDSSQSFKAKVEHGDQMHLSQQVRGGIQERTLKWIWLMGPIHIFRWITDIALGIEELEDLGIYHADLFFRNTIRVTKGNKFSFKIIDFDKAFKITQTQKRDKSFKRTEDMFDFWLRFNFEGNPRQPAYRLDIQSVSSQKTRNAYNERDILEYIFGQNKPMIEQLVAIKRQSIFLTERLSKCLKLLSQHMQTSHLEQYSALVLNLLFPKNEQEQKFVGEFINEQKIFEIIEELERLKEGNISYTDFAEKVRMIGGFQKDKDEDEEYEK